MTNKAYVTFKDLSESMSDIHKRINEFKDENSDDHISINREISNLRYTIAFASGGIIVAITLVEVGIRIFL